jgi:hypothetical protein
MSDTEPKKSLLSRANARGNWITLWLPLCATLALLVFFAFVPVRWEYVWLRDLLSHAYLACLGYFLLLLFLRLVQRKWAAALAASLCLVLSLVAMVPSILLGMVIALARPSEDGFANDLKIPEGISIADPKRQSAKNKPFANRGSATFELYNSFQPGIYDSHVWANPGEPGMVYLKAFEITRDYQLSKSRLSRDSNERIGWSDDPNELFASKTHFTIREGDWGQPYAARFELWFVPDSGAPERKLLEKNFKIEGWMR